jgi:hypothetical protein
MKYLLPLVFIVGCTPVDQNASVCDQWQTRIASANALVAAADLAVATFLETSGPGAQAPSNLLKALAFAKASLAAVTAAAPVACQQERVSIHG